MSPNFAIRAGATAILSLLVSVPVFAADPASLTRVSRNPFGKTRDGIAVEQVTLPLERFPEAATADLGATSLFELLEERWGARPAQADQRILAVTIRSPEAELLGVPAGHPGLRFESLARDADGLALYFAVSLFRGDRYEIELRQERPS